jgi:hypothetical protein
MIDLTPSEAVPDVVRCLQPARLYVGFRLDGKWIVKADDKPIEPQRSQAVRNHSPDGFSWGYGGSGPAQLALALLLHAGLNDSVAGELYQSFKWQIVAQWSQHANWLLRGSDLVYWIEQQLYAAREKQLFAEGGPLDEP